LQVTVQGSGTLLSQVVSIFGDATGVSRWFPQVFSFTANSASTTLTFTDVSPTSDSLDLLLDNVRVTPQSTSPALLVNGSFESGYNGWTETGNQVAKPAASPYQASDGTMLVVFNGGQTTPNGVLSQSFATTSGQIYTLAFDAGVLAYNQNEQRLQVTVQGSGTLLSKVVSIFGNGLGTTKWVPQSFTFTANSSASTLTFTDVSPTSNSLDLLLDHVRVAAGTSIPAGVSLVLGGSESGEGTVLSMAQTDLGWRIAFQADAPAVYTLERSTDLKAWAPVDQVNAANAGPVELNDTSPSETMAFYRVVQVPPVQAAPARAF
jgi:major type 1 subunit fimbrin (pilin)